MDPIASRGFFNTRYGVDWYGYANQNQLLYTDRTGKNPICGNWCGPDGTDGKTAQDDGNNVSPVTRGLTITTTGGAHSEREYSAILGWPRNRRGAPRPRSRCRRVHQPFVGGPSLVAVGVVRHRRFPGEHVVSRSGARVVQGLRCEGLLALLCSRRSRLAMVGLRSLERRGNRRTVKVSGATSVRAPSAAMRWPASKARRSDDAARARMPCIVVSGSGAWRSS
ncbi:hypothetical protein Adeh_1415 [Anaeromyxobacter dehalogenans 2CP-C]|uniref:Uncharacterized protein n=1 Tax=Anaeromyxobacter dehalogenans (strain 2CP-C) TaxID=290397 RepID=Q2IQV3_ANADE|nr:hypothetical protein Adeh_1415 [Anaeromyxobacter dehalogenans 2CP-C]